MREYFDLVLIVPLEEELEEVMNTFTAIENRSTTTEFRYVIKTFVPDIHALVVQQEEMGKSHAIQSTSGVLTRIPQIDCDFTDLGRGFRYKNQYIAAFLGARSWRTRWVKRIWPPFGSISTAA